MKRKGVIFDVTNTPRPKFDVTPEAILFANQRHLEVCQERNGKYTVLTDTDGLLERGALIEHDAYSTLIRSGCWVNVVPVELVLLADKHSLVDADGFLAKRRY